MIPIAPDSFHDRSLSLQFSSTTWYGPGYPIRYQERPMIYRGLTLSNSGIMALHSVGGIELLAQAKDI